MGIFRKYIAESITTEEDFQSALDANPSDWQTRLVFADWLQEKNDPRAEGYRVLGKLKLYPFHFPQQEEFFLGQFV